MALSYLNTNQTVNGNGQAVPTNTSPEGISAPYQQYVASMTGTGTVTASVQVQGSNDGVNWVNIGSAMSASGTAPVGSFSNASYAWYRAAVSAITGTNAAVTTTMNV